MRRAAVLAAVAGLGAGPGLAAAPVATMVRMAGPADVRQAGAWRDASAGDRLEAGDAARTGRQGYATLRNEAGIVTELYPLTLVEWPAEHAFSALAGRVWARFRQGSPTVREIRTPSAVALIRGTTLSVSVTDTQTRVVVLEGLVEVLDVAGRARFLTDGYAVLADRDGLRAVERASALEIDEGRAFRERTRQWAEPAPELMGGISEAPLRNPA